MPMVFPPSASPTPAGSPVEAKSLKGRAGRPAKAGARYPSGQLKPAEKRGEAPAPALLKRVFDAALRDGREPLLGTSLGLLFMRGAITAPQLAAGLAYARLQGRYDRVMGLPCRSAMSPDYGAARASADRVPMTDDEVAAVKDRHARTVAVLGTAPEGGLRRAGGEVARPVQTYEARRTAALVERVCVDDLACESYELDRLKAALQTLAPWFGIDPKKNI